MNEQPVSDSQWCENIIIANADFIDRVAFDLTVNSTNWDTAKLAEAVADFSVRWFERS